VEIKSKKPRQPNWENVEILALIKGKKTEHEASLILVDFRNNMEMSITKWKHISTFFMPNGHSKHFHTRTTCNNKWGSLYGNYKKIIDYMGVIGHNEDYWEMSTEDRVTQGLPRSFNKPYFDLIGEFMHNRLCFNLPHSFIGFHESRK
jgi:hypothetical protein